MKDALTVFPAEFHSDIQLQVPSALALDCLIVDVSLARALACACAKTLNIDTEVELAENPSESAHVKSAREMRNKSVPNHFTIFYSATDVV